MLKLYKVLRFKQIYHFKMGIYNIPTLITLKDNKQNLISYECITDLKKTDSIPRGGYGLIIFYHNIKNHNEKLAMKLLNVKYITEIKKKNMDVFYKEEYFFKLLNTRFENDEKLKGCKHNLIEFITSDKYNYDGIDYYFILLKKMDMDLHNYLFQLKEGLTISLYKAKKIIYQIAKSLDCLHKLNYVYNDLKPDNILINKDGETRLTDFNCITKINENSSFKSCSTHTFRSPEQINYSMYGNNPLIDSWQLGLLILCILTKNTKSIVQLLSDKTGENDKYIINHLNKNQVNYYLSICQHHYTELKDKKEFNLLKNIIYRLLTKNINKRLSISKLLTNSFFDFDKKKSISYKKTDRNKKYKTLKK